MKPSKPFVMPPVRIIPPTLEGQSESSKSLEEWLNTEETVRDLHFGKRTEEHMEYSYKSITNCTFSHIQFSACKRNEALLCRVAVCAVIFDAVWNLKVIIHPVPKVLCSEWNSYPANWWEPICRKQY